MKRSIARGSCAVFENLDQVEDFLVGREQADA